MSEPVSLLHAPRFRALTTFWSLGLGDHGAALSLPELPVDGVGFVFLNFLDLT